MQKVHVLVKSNTLTAIFHGAKRSPIGDRRRRRWGKKSYCSASLTERRRTRLVAGARLSTKMGVRWWFVAVRRVERETTTLRKSGETERV